MPKLLWNSLRDSEYPNIYKEACERLGIKEISVAFNRAICYDVFDSLNIAPYRSALGGDWKSQELWVLSPSFLVCRNFGLLWCNIFVACPQSKKAKELEIVQVKFNFPENPVIYEFRGKYIKGTSYRDRACLIEGDLGKIESFKKKTDKSVKALKKKLEAYLL